MQPLAGVKVVELATFGFVPSGVAILADWGAEVVKVEHPRIPDPMRGLVRSATPDGHLVDTLMDHLNRGKRNLALDLGQPRGLEVFNELIRRSDVFITNFLAPAQRKLRITYDDLRAVNASIVYAHGHGYGPRGPDAEQPGFDGISYWARGGVGHTLTFRGGPPAQQRPAFGDVMGGLAVAAGVAAAMHRKRATGEGCTVDVSLLAVACWQLAPDLLASSVTDQDVQAMSPGPDSGPFRTSDGRFVTILLLLPHYLQNTLRALGLHDLLDDPTFRDFKGGLGAPGADLIDATLRKAIGSITSEELRSRFAGKDIAWSVIQTPQEVAADSQVEANGYLVPNPANPERFVVSGPVQFNQTPPRPLTGSPRQGEHTSTVLRDLGLDSATIEELTKDGITAQGSDGLWDEYGRLRS